MSGRKRSRGRGGVRGGGGGGKPPRQPQQQSQRKRRGPRSKQHKKERKEAMLRHDAQEIRDLEKQTELYAPPRGTNPLSADASTASSREGPSGERKQQYRLFSDIPISQRTLQALQANKFTRLTDIQRAALPHALAGRDILGAARTGSGKTLAFLIPVLEKLYRLGWNQIDGVGAIIISPTRELAVQIFDVLRTVGSHHELSAGLVIGGKDVMEEQNKISLMNILVCTPGRLLQHLEQTYGFECNNLQMLVLDEADRILDMGFEETLTNIVRALPSTRQTLLFSATQTKSVKQLARLSLDRPEYLSVHENDDVATPVKLAQHCMVVEAPEKLDVLYSFIRSHLKSKCIVFVSSCKQVRFLFEAFRRIRPGVPLMAIHGKQKQHQRLAIYYDFVQKKAAVLFATDLAARGLDFPAVDWVVQLDCPDSPETYIHRVGRTARYKAGGNALLVLLPSEKAMLKQLKTRKVPINRIKANPKKVESVTQHLRSILAANEEVKYLGQRAFVSYLRSVHLASDKTVFDVSRIPTAELADSMGLPGAPKLKFLSGGSGRSRKNLAYGLQELIDEEDDDEEDDDDDADEDGEDKKKKNRKDKKKTKKSAVDRLLGRQNQTVFSETRARMRASSDDDDEGDGDGDGGELLVVKRRIEPSSTDEPLTWTKEEIAKMSRRQRKQAEKLRKGALPAELVSSDEDEDEDEEGEEEEEESSDFVDDGKGDEADVEAEDMDDMPLTRRDMRHLCKKAAQLAELTDEQRKRHRPVSMEDVEIDAEAERKRRLAKVAAFLLKEDVVDKQTDRERVQQLHRARRLKAGKVSCRPVRDGDDDGLDSSSGGELPEDIDFLASLVDKYGVDDDDDDPKTKKRARPADSDDDGDDSEKKANTKKQKKDKKASLADLEAKALALLDG